MEVLTRVDCVDCGATGKVLHPVIAAFVEADNKHKEETGYHMGTIKRNQWFKINGYKEPIVDKIKCEACQATGKIMVWRSLEEMKKLLKKDSE